MAAPAMFQCRHSATRPARSLKKSLCAGCTSSTLGSCLTTMVSASPSAKPRSTGLAIRLDTAPSRATPAITKNTPASSTMPMPIASRVAASTPVTEVVAANSTAAEEEVAETIAKRLLPKRP